MSEEGPARSRGEASEADVVLASLRRRHSVRQFTPEPVSARDEAAILDAAAQAPTAGNQQMYTILRITDQAVQERLAVLCDDQPLVARAPLVLVFCADYQKWYDAFLLAGRDVPGWAPRDPGEGELMLAVQDTLIAAQNAVVAAEALGLGSCYIGDILEHLEEVKPLLGLPDLVVPATLLVIGHPTEQQRRRSKPGRCPQELMVADNRYRRLGEDELRALWAERAGRHTWSEWMRGFCARKYESDFSREMTRSVRAYARLFTTYGERRRT